MGNKLISVVGSLLLCASVSSQEQPRELRGGGHLLEETAEQFFSEGLVGDVLRACQARDWRSVSTYLGHTSKTTAKGYCAKEKAPAGTSHRAGHVWNTTAAAMRRR